MASPPHVLVLVTRPIVALGADIGYMPGSKDDKMHHWMQPIFDNLAFMSNTADAQTAKKLTTNPYAQLTEPSAGEDVPAGGEKPRRRHRRQRMPGEKEDSDIQRQYQTMGYGVAPVTSDEEDDAEAAGVSGQFIAQRKTQSLIQEKVQMEAITFLRGRSIQNEYVVVDECQNLTPHEVKTIISRAAEGTKIVLCGDPLQIDNPLVARTAKYPECLVACLANVPPLGHSYLDATTNGLTYVVDRLRGVSMYGHVMLKTTVRSTLAAVAAEML